MERFRETYDRVTSVIYVHKYITHTQCITTTVLDYAYTYMCGSRVSFSVRILFPALVSRFTLP